MFLWELKSPLWDLGVVEIVDFTPTLNSETFALNRFALRNIGAKNWHRLRAEKIFL